MATSRGGGSRARTGVPVRLSIRQKSVNQASVPTMCAPQASLRRFWESRAGTSSRGNTSRASFGESTSQRWRREVVDVRGGVTSAHVEVRDEVIRKDLFTPPAKSQKEQALESTPMEGVSGNENTRRVTMTRVEVALVGPASVARLQGRGQEQGPRQRRQR